MSKNVCLLCGLIDRPNNIVKVFACMLGDRGVDVELCETCHGVAVGNAIEELKGNLLHLRGWLEDVQRLANNLPEGYRRIIMKKLSDGELPGAIKYLKSVTEEM